MDTTKSKKKQAEDEMFKKVKEIINTEAQKHPDFEIIPVCVYPKDKSSLPVLLNAESDDSAQSVDETE